MKVCRVLNFSERHLKKVDAVKTSQSIFGNEILIFISTITCLARYFKIGGEMSGFMSNYDPVLVNRLAIRPEKHIDIHILWN